VINKLRREIMRWLLSQNGIETGTLHPIVVLKLRAYSCLYEDSALLLGKMPHMELLRLLMVMHLSDTEADMVVSATRSLFVEIA